MADASDILGMSDEDFLKNPPAVEVIPPVEKVEAVASGEIPPVVKEIKTEPVVAKAPVQVKVEPVVLDPHADAASKKEKGTEAAAEVVAAKPAKEAIAKTETVQTDDSDTSKGETEDDGATTEEQSQDAPLDYEALYKRIMLPFKANGRTIELKTPDEAVQLMQMGANYTKKMQELVPHRKMLTMLQNNGLMDEGKLSYLIDLDKKNPEAIKKLIKDAGIDPQEIDTSVEPTYREGNHRVSDEEVAFHSTLDDMKSTPERLATLQVINGNWDQASKEALWKSPEIMTVIHGQRESGVYDRIVTEVNRRQTLGQIPANVPFLQAYKTVGDQMTAAKAFADLTPQTVVPVKAPVVATRVAVVKPAVTNSARAAAASPNRSTPAASKTSTVNPLAMADADFMKQFAGRV